MKIKHIIFMCLFFFFLLGCEDNEKKVEEQRFVFNTLIKIVVYHKNENIAREGIEAAFGELERIDKTINNHSEKGDIYRVNHSNNQFVEVTTESAMLIKDSIKYSDITKGKFDVTIAPVIKLWNFDEAEHQKLPDDNEMKKMLELVNYKEIELNDNKIRLKKKNAEIEIGSFLKGYAIKRARDKMLEKGIKSAFISAISSISTINTKPGEALWIIGLDDPQNNGSFLYKLALNNKSMGVAGDYQTFVIIGGKKYHHILDTKTGYPVNGVKMVVVISDDAYTSDMLDTIIFILGVKEGLKLVESIQGVECMIVDKDMKQYLTKGFKKYIYEK